MESIKSLLFSSTGRSSSKGQYQWFPKSRFPADSCPGTLQQTAVFSRNCLFLFFKVPLFQKWSACPLKACWIKRWFSDTLIFMQKNKEKYFWILLKSSHQNSSKCSRKQRPPLRKKKRKPPIRPIFTLLGQRIKC